MTSMTDLAAGRGLLHVRGEGDTIVLAVEGPLDAGAGEVLLAAICSTGGSTAVEIDLRGITAYTEGGAMAFGRCRALADALPRRVSYRPGSRLGQALMMETLRFGGSP